ncbi:MAG: DUF1080 domain-containing protein [Lewinella sp.]|nr:DUF1080 domain-containing protein [Lewinella sp.]
MPMHTNLRITFMPLFFLLAILLVGCQPAASTEAGTESTTEEAAASEPALNTLTEAEQAAGWQLLFDGQTTNGWHNYLADTIGESWIVEDGALTLDAVKQEDWRWQAPHGGDIVSDQQFGNFELQLEWKISDCGNSGIMYRVVEDEQYTWPWLTGPEMQVLDNKCHPDRELPSHRAGSLYDFIEAQPQTVKPAGEWNQVRIIMNGTHLEHWLNGEKVVDTDLGSDAWKEMVANSKFGRADSDTRSPNFAKATRGHIALQDHNDSRVAFRNIKIREL